MKGILLYGPPGTGKTMLARAMANESGSSFISISAADIMSKNVGESAKKIRDLFKQARDCAPTTIFIDEIDSMAKQRQSGGNSEHEQVKCQLL